MRRGALIFAVLLAALLTAAPARAQFKDAAFSQSYNDDPSSPSDSTDTFFSFKEYFGGLGHKNPVTIRTMTLGSFVFVGGSQIYNRDYWKLPIVYGGVLGGTAAGFALKGKGNDKAATYCFAAAGLTYWASLMDGVAFYESDQSPLPGRATFYSLLLPGLGQIYNGEAWKLPIYWGGLMGSFHFYSLNRTNYERFRRIYNESTNPDVPYTGPISSETALYYRNLYRRYRDYSVLAIAAFYLLQVIDANVFSYMHSFNMSDDIALSAGPAVITPDTSYAFSPSYNPAFGMRFGITF